MPASKAKTAKPQLPDSITLTWKLADLPGSQHKAGLAGLILQIRSMQARKLPAETIPVIIGDVKPSGATVRFTRASLQGVMDDLYDATLRPKAELQIRKDKKTKKEIKPKSEGSEPYVDEKTGETRTRKVFFYDDTEPCGHVMTQHLPEGGLWMKLWRDFIWAVPRVKTTSRGPFDDRSGRTGGRRPAAYAGRKDGEAVDGFQLLLRESPGKAQEVGLSGALLIGLQGLSAESVKASAPLKDSLLLHFWTNTAFLCVPQALQRIKGRTPPEWKMQNIGFVAAIPEVVDLEWFTETFPVFLAGLKTDPAGFRPAEALISVPEEGGLVFCAALQRLAAQRFGMSSVRTAVVGVDLIHAEKTGDDAKVLSRFAIKPAGAVLNEYDSIRSECRNALFRTARLRALLRGEVWHEHFGKFLEERPWYFFVLTHGERDATPPAMMSFAGDARRQFQRTVEEHAARIQLQQVTQTTSAMNEPSEPPTAAPGTPPAPARPIDLIVYDMIRTYVRHKAEAKSGLKRVDFKDKKDDKGRTIVPEKYREAQEKVCEDAFLAFRSRRDRDFADYFTATAGSVSQWLPPQDYLVLVGCLLQREGGWQDVKTLAMLALSACSPSAGQSESEAKAT